LCAPPWRRRARQRLAATGLCPEAAAALIPGERLAGELANEGPTAGCDWTIRDVAIAGADEAIVYRALRCNGVATAFEFAGGAHSASLAYQAAALGAPAGHEAVRIFVSDPQAPTQVIASLIDALAPAERAKCEVQPARIDGWPSDALVIGYNEAAAATLPKDEPNAVCGEFGLDEDAAQYWLVRDGFAYFFNLGQDALEFDPNSLTLVRKGADGSWTPAQQPG
jgi:hypothetical protein